MNLQFFAENQSDNDKGAETQEPQVSDSQAKEKQVEKKAEDVSDEQKDKTVIDEQSVQNLLLEIAKQKRAIDKLTKENGELTKKYRSTLSEQERASMEKAEAEAARQAEFDDMKRRLAINDLVSEYMDRQFPKEIATKIATARYDGDNETVNIIEKQMDEAKRKKWEAEFLASRPELKTGVGETQTISKEQFDKMSLIEKTKLKRENEAEYNRLVAL